MRASMCEVNGQPCPQAFLLSNLPLPCLNSLHALQLSLGCWSVPGEAGVCVLTLLLAHMHSLSFINTPNPLVHTFCHSERTTFSPLWTGCSGKHKQASRGREWEITAPFQTSSFLTRVPILLFRIWVCRIYFYTVNLQIYIWRNLSWSCLPDSFFSSSRNSFSNSKKWAKVSLSPWNSINIWIKHLWRQGQKIHHRDSGDVLRGGTG